MYLEIIYMACREYYHRHKATFILYGILILLTLGGSAYGSFVDTRYIFITTWWPFAAMLSMTVIYMLFIHSLNNKLFLNKSNLLRGAEYKIIYNIIFVYLPEGKSHCIDLCSSGRVIVRKRYLVVCYGKSYHLIPLRFFNRSQLSELLSWVTKK